MKLPGRAWLHYEAREAADGSTHLEQTAAFIPRGLMGLVYWYGLYPVHSWVFGGLIRAIVRRSEEHEASPPDGRHVSHVVRPSRT